MATVVQTDPIADVELELADGLIETLADALDWAPERVDAHFREDTLVFLVEGEAMPEETPARVRDGNLAAAQTVTRVLGRETLGEPFRTRLSPREAIVVVRLA